MISDAAALAEARRRFLADHVPGTTPTPPTDATVPLPIIGSWQRSAHAGVDAHGSANRHVTITEDTALSRCARDPMRQLVHALGSLDIGVVLSDAHSHVLARVDSGRDAASLLNGIDLAPGFDFSEGFVGTNGVGTAIETRRPIFVAGPAHFQERFLDVVCAGAPIIHPITGHLEGVIDLTCGLADASLMMQTIAVQTARAIEAELLQASSPVERRVFEAFARADTEAAGRSRRLVLATTGMMALHSGRAGRLLDEPTRRDLCHRARAATCDADQARFRFEATARGAAGDTDAAPDRMLLDVAARRIGMGADRGVLVEATVTDTARPASAGRPARAPTARTASPVGPDVVDGTPLGRGSVSSAWRLARRELTQSLQREEAALLLGEIGVGKVSLVNEVAAAQGLHVHVLSPELVHEARGVRRALASFAHTDRPIGDPVLVMRNVTLLDDAERAEVTRFLRAPRVHGDPVRLVLTGEGGEIDEASPLAPMLPFIGRTIIVPALRQRQRDLPGIVASLLEALQPSAHREVSVSALRTIAAGHWPGNIHQLTDALRYALARRPSGPIQVADLPPHAFSAALRPLTTLEQQERSAIITTLYRTHGNRTATARALGLSRSTLYRRLAEYGLRD